MAGNEPRLAGDINPVDDAYRNRDRQRRDLEIHYARANGVPESERPTAIISLTPTVDTAPAPAERDVAVQDAALQSERNVTVLGAEGRDIMSQLRNEGKA